MKIESIAKLSIGRIHSNDENRNNTITIEIVCNELRVQLLIKPIEFAKAVTGLGNCPCELTAWWSGAKL